MPPQQPQKGPVTDMEVVINGKTYPKGTPAEVVRAALKGDSGPTIGATPRPQPANPPPDLRTPEGFARFANPSPTPAPTDYRSSRQQLKDFASDVGSGVGDILDLAGNTVKFSPLGFALSGTGGVIKGLSTGQSPIDTALANMGINVAFRGVPGSAGAVRKGLSKVLPWVEPERAPGLIGNLMEGGVPQATEYSGHRAAMAFAGLRGDTPDTTRQIADDIISLRRKDPTGATRFSVGGPTLGNPRTTAREIKSTSDALHKAEAASPATVKPIQFGGMTDKIAEDMKSTPGSFSGGNLLNLRNQEDLFLKDQTFMQMLKDAGIDPTTASDKQLQALQNVFNKPKTARVLTGQEAKVQLDMPTLGDIRRRNRDLADPFIRARVRGEQITPENRAGGLFNESIYRQAKDLQDKLNPEVVPINDRLKKLFGIAEATKNMGGESVGAASVRGGLGAGMFGGVSRTVGREPGGLGGAVGALLALLHPRLQSSLASGSNTFLQSVPGLLDAININEDVDKMRERNKLSGAMSGVTMKKP